MPSKPGSEALPNMEVTEEMIEKVTEHELKGKIPEALFATLPAKVCAALARPLLLLRAYHDAARARATPQFSKIKAKWPTKPEESDVRVARLRRSPCARVPENELAASRPLAPPQWTKETVKELCDFLETPEIFKARARRASSGGRFARVSHTHPPLARFPGHTRSRSARRISRSRRSSRKRASA